MAGMEIQEKPYNAIYRDHWKVGCYRCTRFHSGNEACPALPEANSSDSDSTTAPLKMDITLTTYPQPTHGTNLTPTSPQPTHRRQHLQQQLLRPLRHTTTLYPLGRASSMSWMKFQHDIVLHHPRKGKGKRRATIRFKKTNRQSRRRIRQRPRKDILPAKSRLKGVLVW